MGQLQQLALMTVVARCHRRFADAKRSEVPAQMGFGLHSGYSPTRQMAPWPTSLPDARRLDFSSPYASAYSGAALGAPGINAYLNGYSNALTASPSEVQIIVLP